VKVEVYKSLEKICHAAAESFLNLIDGSNLSIVVPGGNTPKDFFHVLAQANIDWRKISLILSDERMVQVNHQASNHGMIKETLLKRLSEKNRPTVIPDMENFIEVNSEEFLDETNSSIKKKIPIKYAFLGMGSDGHTASLFPGHEIVSINSDPFFYTHKQGDDYQRITLSMDFLQSIPYITFLVSGKSKYTDLKAILKGNKIIDKSPAHQLIDQSYGQVSILCDQKAWPTKVNA